MLYNIITIMNKNYELITLNKSFALPLANQLAQRILWMIAGGIISEGEILPNIRDMGEYLGVHMHTVRAAYHILEDKDVVMVKPRAGTIVKKYTPFTSQDQVFSIQNRQIAVLIPEMTPFYYQIFKGIQSAADPDRYLPLVIPCGDDPIFAEAVYSDISAGGFAGVINISLGFSDMFYKNFAEENRLSIPLIFIGDFNARTHRVVLNTVDAISQGTNHLIQHGYEEIGLINCPKDWPVGREIYKGYSTALVSHNLQTSMDLVFSAPDFTIEAGIFCAEQILKHKLLPRALMAASDTLALGAMFTFQQHGLKIPDDISIIGYNNIAQSTISSPPLTTIALPTYEIGFQAMQSMKRIINKEISSWEHHTFSGKLIVRNSCGKH